MTSSETLLAEIVADFTALQAAYGAAGLFDEITRGSAAWTLLGGGDIGRFQRDVLLAGALMRNRVAQLVLDGGKQRHVAVFGGNNVGKSTVVNILAKSAIAGTSPAGGHTRHAHGFTADPAHLFGRNPYAFQGFSAVAAEALSSDRFDCYAVSRLTGDALPSDIVLWDVPDCNAVGSSRYLAAVVEAVAVADVVLYVTSVDSYAVEHLVEWVFCLNGAGIPLVECLNKTPKRDRDVVISRQHDAIFPIMAARLGMTAPAPVIVALRTMVEGDESDLWGPEHAEAGQLRETVVAALGHADRGVSGRAALTYLIQQLPKTLEPLSREITAYRTWPAEVDRAIRAFLASYERDYLTASTVIEPISRLNLGVLDLLDPDIPGLKTAMATLRWVTRWPAKLMLAAGRHVFNVMFRDGNAAKDAPLAPELQAYSDAHAQLLNTLGNVIDDQRRAQPHHPFWDALSDAWQARLPGLSVEFGQAVEATMKRTDAEIKEAAAEIFQSLQGSPTILNILRGVRVAANTGGALVGFLLPVKGGMIYDLIEEAILAPAMISATEAATRAATENFVTGRRDRVVARLKADAGAIAESLYRAPLLALAEQAKASACPLGIGDTVLERLPANLLRLQARVAS